MEEKVLLNNFLETDESTFQTDDEKRAYIQQIESLWTKISDEDKSEELLLKVLNRIKAFKGEKSVVWNKEGIINVYESFPNKSNDIYLKALNEIKCKLTSDNGYHYRDNSVIEAFLEFIPEDLKNKDGYIDVLKHGINDFRDFARIYKNFIPESIRTKSFNEDFIDSLEENDIEAGRYFWIEIPTELKTKDFFFKFAKKTDWISFCSILKDNKNFIESDNILELYEILLQKEEARGSYHIGELGKLIPKHLFTPQIYTGIMNILLNYDDSVDAITQKMDIVRIEFFSSMPEESQSKEQLLKILDKLEISNFYTIHKYMDAIPNQLKNSEIYLEILKRSALEKDNRPKDRCEQVFNKIPEEYKIAEMIIEASEFIDESLIYRGMTKLEDEFREKNLYPLLMEKMAERGHINFSRFLNSIPKEYITEENLLKMFAKLENDALGTNKLFEAIEQDKENFSEDFYRKLLSNNKDNFAEIYKSMPNEYKTEDMFLKALCVNIDDSSTLRNYLKSCPMNMQDVTSYQKIIEYIYSQKDISDSLKANGLTQVIRAIKNSEMRYEISEFAINKAKTEKDDAGNTVYTPKKAFEIFNSLLGGNDFFTYIINEENAKTKKLLQKTKIFEYLDEVIENEKNNILNGKINEAQIKEYEKELNIDSSMMQKNPFWALNAVYYSIPVELQHRYKKDINEFLKNNIYKLENDNNKLTIEFMKRMIESNEDLFFTLDNRFLESDKYITKLGAEKYEVIVSYPNIQSIIANFNDDYFEMFSSCINYSSDFSKTDKEDTGDWVPIAYDLCSNLNNKNFKEINDEIVKLKFDNLSEDLKNKYLSIITKEKNWFEITTIDELENFEEIKKQVCKKILENPEDLKGLPASIRGLDKKERIIFARLQLEYGIDLIEARNLVEKYADGLSDNQKREEIGKLLLNIEKIINIDEEEIHSLLNFDEKNIRKTDYRLLLNLEAKCRESYLDEYNNVTYNPAGHLEDETQIVAEYNGKKIKVFEPKENFNMVIHALGAYSDKSEREDYKVDWNMPKIGNHGLCTSFIGNNNLGTARVVNVMYGFSNFSPEQLLLSAPWDIISRNANTMFSTSDVKYNFENGVKFFSPSLQIDNTRHTHNEIVFDRRQFEKGEHSKKMQPSYIVYMPDYLNGKKPEEIDAIINNRDEALKEYMEKDERWKEAQKAAAQFDVPIVIVDRAVCAERESKKISELVNSFEETKDMSLISKIITEFENNRAGNRDYHKEITQKYFSEEILEDYIGRIENVISDLSTKNQRKVAYEVLKQAFDDEAKKREAFRKTGEDPITKFWQDKSFEIYTKERRNSNTHEIEIEQVIDKLSDDGKLQSSTISKKVIDEIKDMKSREMYSDKKAHSDRHIQNVMLFASMLGEATGLDEKEQKLLLEAAKFHDSGRRSDNDRNHAETGAKIAGEKLKSKYNEQDLAIMQIAIEYHEMVENTTGKLDENKLSTLFNKYKLNPEHEESAKKISELLKDADALDRTRFVGKAKLDSKFLHSSIAKDLIELATAVNEEYAKKDLGEICEENESLRESIEGFRDKNDNSSLATIWAIRHHKFIPKKSVKASMEELYEVSSEILPEVVLDIQKEMVNVEEEKQVVAPKKSEELPI